MKVLHHYLQYNSKPLRRMTGKRLSSNKDHKNGMSKIAHAVFCYMSNMSYQRLRAFLAFSFSGSISSSFCQYSFALASSLFII